MAGAAAEVKRIGVGELRAFVSDKAELQKGTKLYDDGFLSNLARYQNKLFCDAKGSGASPYKVTVTYTEKPTPGFKSQCSCPARKFQSALCKHGAALMVAWARAPESFLVSEGPPGGGEAASGGAAKREVKKGKVSTQELMRTGVEQVCTLVRELGVAGVASLSHDRVDQLQTLGQTLRENRLRRLSARAIDLAQQLAAVAAPGGAVRATAYTGLMADLLLTARKLEKHLAGEALEDRHVEELIGKTWQKSDRKPVTDLQLVEYSFSTRTTSDDFVIRESRFLDLATGNHYSEKQIVPAFMAKRGDPKPSRAGQLLAGARGTTFPGFAPFRIDFDDLGDKKPIDSGVLEVMVDKALPDVGAALAALQEHRKDVFAPDLLPVALRASTLLFRGSRLEALDDTGHALHLPEDQALEERIAGSLHDGKLRALLGDVGIDAALPTLWPVAAIIQGPLGLELRAVVEPGAPRRGPLEGSAWAAAARAAGMSPAAIALGEVREELADAFVTGLAGLGPRVTDPLAARLRELGLEKQAALLQGIAQKPEPEGRIDDFIKLYQVLEIALVRLAGAAHVDRDKLVQVPTYESVFVEQPPEPLPPAEVTRRRAQGAMNRYQAAVHYARHYEALPPEELAANIFPIWADGAAAPYIARAFASRPEEGLLAVERSLQSNAGRTARMTAVRVLQAIGGRTADDILSGIVRQSKDAGLRAMALDALDTLVAQKLGPKAVQQRRAKALEQVEELSRALLTAPRLDERISALHQLEAVGNRAAIPAIRQAFWGDASQKVRTEAAHSLALLGDTDMVEVFVRMLAARGEDESQAKVAAQALGLLGDVRGLNELLAAYADGYKPGMVVEAIRAFGPVALEPLVELVEVRPEIAKRQAALDTLRALDDKELAECLLGRLKAREGAPDLAEKAQVYLKVADVHVYTKRQVAHAVLEMLGKEVSPPALAAARMARRALGVTLRE